MSLFIVRSYLKQRYDSGIEFEIWEDCLYEIFETSDQSKFEGTSNDKFHFNWEIMMSSLYGERKITLKEFYNCECNGFQTDSWDTIVFIFYSLVVHDPEIDKKTKNRKTVP